MDGYQFSKRYKKKQWNGKIYLFSAATGKIYNGLIPKVCEYANWKGFEFDLSEYPIPDKINLEEAKRFLKTLPLVDKKPRDYQVRAFLHAIKNDRAALLAGTGAGKSLLIYMLWLWYQKHGDVLLIVPKIALAQQMLSDFESYSGRDLKDEIHTIFEDAPKETDKKFIIATWQSLQNFEPKFFKRFKTIFLDEAHNGKANSIRKIISACTNARYRFGLTGTIDNGQSSIPRIVIEGLFGPVYTVAKTYELIEKKVLSDVEVQMLILKHKDYPALKYQAEIDYICAHEKRNRFIANLAKTRKGATLVFFERVEKHGEVLYKLLKEDPGDKNIYIIHGKSGDAKFRESVRKIVDSDPNAVMFGSYGSNQEGINIPNLKHIILASPLKSQIRLLQSIGRGTRRNEGTGKTSCTVYDLADDMRQPDGYNTTLKHSQIRFKIYKKEKFPVKIIKVEL